MYIALHFIVIRLPDSLRAVRDHFLALDPTALNVDLLEQHLLAAKTSVVAVGAARGTPRTPFFEGCSPSPLAPSYASTAAVDVLGAADIGAASAARERVAGVVAVAARVVVGAAVEVVEAVEVVAAVGVVAGVGALAVAVVAAVGVAVVAVVAAVGVVAVGLELLSKEVLAVARGSSSSVGAPTASSGVAIFDLDYDAILAAMYALSVSAEGDCYLCVPPDPVIEATALGASESALPGIVPAEALHTFTLDSGASRCFFHDSTTLTPLSAPVPVRLADPSRGLVVARSSTVLPCPAVSSGSRSGLHLPSFSTNLVSTAALQDAIVTTTTPRGQCVLICTCTRTGHHLATFTHRPRSSLYTLATEPPQVAASAQVSASGPVAAPCSCRLLVSGLPRSLPPLPPSPSPPCLPCVKGRQRAAPHSSFPPTIAPLQTLHMDINGEVHDVLIPWIRTVRLQLREWLRQNLHVLRLHSDRGGEFSSDLLRYFCRGEGILHSFTLPASPQQNGIAERRIGLVMEVASTSMIHAAAPHFIWPFAVRYAAHQLNLWPCVSLPETSPTLRWTGEVGDASVFRVWGSRAFVRDTSADKLSARDIPCVFLGFPPDALGWQFYHPTSRRVIPSEDVTFDESVPFYRLFPYRSARPPPPPLFLAPGPPPVDSLPPQGPAPSGVSQVDPLPGTVPVEVVVSSGAARGCRAGGAEPGGAEPGGAEPGGAELADAEPGGGEPEGVEPGGAESEGTESGGAESRGTASSGGPAGASPLLSPQSEPLSPQQLHEWFAQRTRLRSGATRAGVSAAGDTKAGGVGVTAKAGGTGGAAAAGPGGARTRGTGAARTSSVGGVGAVGAGAGKPAERGGAGAGGTGVGGAGVGGAGSGDTGAVGAGAGGTGAGGAGAGGAGAGDTGTVDPRAGGAGVGGAVFGGTCAGGTVRPRSYFVPLLQQTGGLTERREPESRPASPVHALGNGRRVPRPRPPPVPGTHAMALRPSSVPLHVPLPPPPESSLPAVPEPEFDLARAASPTVSRLLATVVTDPSFESTAASALVVELVDFAAAFRLDYATALVAESESASPPSVGGECALGTDVLEDRQEDLEFLAAAVLRFASMLLAPEGDPDAPDIRTPRSYTEAITDPYTFQWQAAMDAEMASWKSTGTYVDAVPPSRANIVDGMWIFRVKRPPGSPLAFKVRYVARGFSQRQGVDYFQTFSPTPKMTTLWVLLHVAAQRTQWSLQWPVYGLRQAPREWHDTLRITLAALGFTPSSADPSLFLRTDTSLPPFYVLVYVDDLVFATADTEALTLVKSVLQKRHTCTDLGEMRSYLGLQITGDKARRTITLTQSHQVLQCFGFQFSSPQPTPLSTSQSLSAPPSDESVEPRGPYPELVGCLITTGMGLVLGGRGPIFLTCHADASWVDNLATQRSSHGYTFSLGSGSVSWRSTRSSLILGSSCEAEIYAGAMAAQELRWLTYLLTDLGEHPRSPPVL
ncbi:unnamed protein product, partial [Closterium sp. NIES-53]